MVELNGHEVGNDGYSQVKPEATTSLFYSAVFPFSPHLNPLPKGERKKENVPLPFGEREG
jgi:hypothetical protein